MNVRGLTFFLLACVLLPFGIFRYVGAATETPFVARPVAESPALDRSLRPVYPYSIVPGGVYSPAELRTRVQQDDLVARHYAGFSLPDTRLVVLNRDALAFVSYRVRDTVFWTKRKLLIPKGETLLSDGKCYARTRCGNRLSATRPPNAPSLAGSEPIAELALPTFSLPLWQQGRLHSLDLPPGLALPAIPHLREAQVPPPPVIEAPPAGPLLRLALPPSVLPFSPSGGFVTASFPPPGTITKRTTPPAITPPAISVPVAAVVAEPASGSLFLLAAILLAVALFCHKLRGTSDYPSR